ncbi:MAG: prenyltransferase [Candidatus Marsarchaeota archaeon]|jgi:1,4-dihydroxy-2-naphthoate octaprenyltransferase|nr:prenyltransferase [Candidatus Marsarchaeota archaeon]
MFKEYLQEVLEPTLLFGVFAGLAGLAGAMYYGKAEVALGVLAIIGVVLAQIGVNLIDDYSDYKTGIDKETKKTKFSGGSILVASKKVSTAAVIRIAAVALTAAGVIGAYLIYALQPVAGYIFILVVIGGLATLFYARYLTHIPFFSEPFVAFCFAIIGVGVFIVSSGGAANLPYIAIACAACGIQVGVAGMANSIPDMKPDRKYGRRSFVVMLKSSKKSGNLYLIFEGIGYALLVAGMGLKVLPNTFVIMVVLMPAMQYVSRGMKAYKNAESYEKVMGVNAALTMVYMLLVSVSYVLAMLMI